MFSVGERLCWTWSLFKRSKQSGGGFCLHAEGDSWTWADAWLSRVTPARFTPGLRFIARYNKTTELVNLIQGCICTEGNKNLLHNKITDNVKGKTGSDTMWCFIASSIKTCHAVMSRVSSEEFSLDKMTDAAISHHQGAAPAGDGGRLSRG